MDSLRKLFTKALSPDYTYQSLCCALPLYDSEKFPRIQGLWKKPCRKSILSDLPSGLHIQKLEFHNIPHSPQEHLVHIVFRIMARVCLKIHSRHLHAPLCGIFGPNSLNVAHYAAFIWAKSPTKWNAQLPESNFQTHSSALSTPKIRYHSSACPLSKNKLYQQHITNGSSRNG